MAPPPRRTAWILFAIALVLFLPGIRWGLPHATGADRILAWGADEVGTLGPVAELYSVFLNPQVFNPQYPLFHYFVMALFVVPYLAYLRLTGGLSGLSSEYPYGLADPASALATMTLLSRLASLLMGAGLVVATWKAASLLWGRRAGLLAALFTMLAVPVVYYARTSNVDLPALFWTSLGFVVFARALKDGLTPRRGIWLGVWAAVAVGTKDNSWAFFLAMGLAVTALQLRAPGPLAERLKPLWMGMATSAALYAFTSGLVFRPSRWRQHVDWVVGAAVSLEYPRTLAGAAGLFAEMVSQIASAMGWVGLLAALAGVYLSRRQPRTTWPALALIVVPVLTIFPVWFLNIRFVLPLVWLLGLYAAVAFAEGLDARSVGTRRATLVVLLASSSWLFVRGLDLTYQSLRDGRYAMGAWLEQHAADQTVGYFGSFRKLPPVPASLAWHRLHDVCTLEEWAGAPDILVIIPQLQYGLEHEWEITGPTWDAIVDGRLGYERVWRAPDRGLFTRLPIPFVDPPMQVFARGDFLATVPEEARRTQRDPALLAPLEPVLAPWMRRARGVVWWSRNEHLPHPCGQRDLWDPFGVEPPPPFIHATE
ncbi:MAG: glycosyltransferase family 39 protein [Gemmatimonadota bacterium]